MSEVPLTPALARAGKVPFQFTVDLNGNGVPDYQEPQELLKLLGNVMEGIIAVAAPHTATAKLARQVVGTFIPAIATGIAGVLR